MEAVGAPASPLDVYELLQKGTVDATVQSIGKYVEAKLWEVCDNFTNAMFISASAATTINLDVWNKMPKDIQDIIAEEALIAEEEIQRLTAEIYYSYLEEMGANMTVYNLPAAERAVWQAELQPVVDEMLSQDGRLRQRGQSDGRCCQRQVSVSVLTFFTGPIESRRGVAHNKM